MNEGVFNMKKQKYINILLILGLIFFFYPLFGLYTFGAKYETFIGTLFISTGINPIYLPYFLIGIIFFGIGFYLDFKTDK